MAGKPIAIDERLADIVKWGRSSARHIEDMTRAAFMADEKTQHAVIKCIESIGEAAKEILKIDPAFERNNPSLRLKAAARMRDRLTHSYRDIDLGVVWATATNSVPVTVAEAIKLLGSNAPL